MFSDCTNLSTIKSKKILDTASTKCYTNIVKGRVSLDKRRLKIIHWQASPQNKLKKIKKGIDKH